MKQQRRMKIQSLFAIVLTIIFMSSFTLPAFAESQSKGLDVIPIFDGITQNTDGSYVAHFGYNNPNSFTVNVTEKESYLNGALQKGSKPPTSFVPGRQYDQFQVIYDGKSIKWNIKTFSGKESSLDSREAVDIIPIFEGVTKNSDGSYTAHWGYNNPNCFTFNVTDKESSFTGKLKKISKPPISFLPGRQVDQFQVVYDGKPFQWKIKTFSKKEISLDSDTTIGFDLASLLKVLQTIKTVAAPTPVVVTPLSPTPTIAPTMTITVAPTVIHSVSPTIAPVVAKTSEPTKIPEVTKTPEPSRVPEDTEKSNNNKEKSGKDAKSTPTVSPSPTPDVTPEISISPEVTNPGSEKTSDPTGSTIIPSDGSTPVDITPPVDVPADAPKVPAFDDTDPITATPDNAGTLQFYTSTFYAYEGKDVGVTVVRTNGSTGSVGLLWNIADSSTAKAGLDYNGDTSGVLTFANGELSKTIKIPILKDSVVEDTESIIINLSSPTGGATLGTNASTTVSIADYKADTKKLKNNTVASVSAWNPTMNLRPGTQIEGMLLVTLKSGVKYNPPPEAATWKSGNEKFAKVSAGIISPVSAGKTAITAKLEGKQVKYNFNSIPTDLNAKLSDGTLVKMNDKNATVKMALNGSLDIGLTVRQIDGVKEDVTKTAVWKSSNAKIASVVDGKLSTTGTPGTATIMATFGGKKIQFKVDTKLISLTAKNVSGSLTIQPDGTFDVQLEVKFADGTTKDVTADAKWTSSSDKVGTVSSGKIKAAPETIVIDAKGKVKAAVAKSMTIKAVYAQKSVSFKCLVQK